MADQSHPSRPPLSNPLRLMSRPSVAAWVASIAAVLALGLTVTTQFWGAAANAGQDAQQVERNTTQLADHERRIRSLQADREAVSRLQQDMGWTKESLQRIEAKLDRMDGRPLP